MKLNKSIGVQALFAAGVLLLGCSPNSPEHAGNISQTGNALIAGVIYNKDGTSAKNAKIQCRKKNSLADTSGVLTKRLVAPDTATATTDNNGKFTIDSIDTGTYILEGSDGGNNRVLNNSVVVNNKNTTVNLPPDTLKPAGAIKGVVQLSENGNPSKVYVLAFGIDRFTNVNADGTFKLDKLAEGEYNLRLTSALDSYGELDTQNIAVTSGDTTNIGIKKLPYSGIPSPKNVTISYDSLSQLVMVRWGKLDTGLVKSFTVYRRNIDSNTTFLKLNKSLIIDTFFIDSTGVQGQTHEYQVTAINKSGNESARSAAVLVKIATYFTLDSMYEISANDMAIAKNGDMYVVNGGSAIGVYDSTMQLKRQIQKPATNGLERISLDNGSIFVSTSTTSIIMVFDSTGTLIDSITDSLPSTDLVSDIDAKNNSVYILHGPQTANSRQMISVYSKDGIRKRAWPLGAASAYNCIFLENSNKIAVSGSDANGPFMTYYDTLGSEIAKTTTPLSSPEVASAFDEKNQILYFVGTIGLIANHEGGFAGTVLAAVDQNNKIVATYKLQNFPPTPVAKQQFTSIGILENGAILVSYAIAPSRILKVKPLF